MRRTHAFERRVLVHSSAACVLIAMASFAPAEVRAAFLAPLRSMVNGEEPVASVGTGMTAGAFGRGSTVGASCGEPLLRLEMQPVGRIY